MSSKNLNIILEIINSNIAILNANGYEVYDSENEDWFLKEIKYNPEDDKMYFKCEEDK